MKQRIISALLGLPLLFAALFLFGTIVPNIAIALLSAMAVWELLHAVGTTSHKPLTFLALIFAASIPFLSYSIIADHLAMLCYLYVLVLCSILLRDHRKLHISQISMSFMCSALIPFSLTTLIYMRDQNGVSLGIFYALVVFASSWLSDTCAYFAGRAFGKHKLAPEISPKKTVEGAIGGAIGAMILTPLAVWIYTLICTSMGISVTVRYLPLILLAPVFSVVSILGDLFASIIKRQYNIKDYGSIMPGHGGVMDRFDSVLMVAPLVYLTSQYLPLAYV